VSEQALHLASSQERCPSDGHLCHYEDHLEKKTQLLLFRPGPENEQQAYFRKFTKITWYFAVVVAAARACFVVCGRCPCRCQ
jgi:hypothetical protein